MYTQQPHTALDVEIQSFAETLNRCFRDSRWDVVSYYAGDAWQAADRGGAQWPEVKARVRTAWEAGGMPTFPKGHRVLANDIAFIR